MPKPEASKRRTAERPPRSRRRVLSALFFFIACVLIVDALVGDQGLLATMRARREYNQLSAELTRLRVENARFREEARRLRQDAAAIEEIARRELGLMSPGEKLFIIRDVIRGAPSSPPAE